MSAASQTANIRPSNSRHVTAVLGPTNTGKTHLAIERMLGHETGLIGLPLRLLAREIYDKIAAAIVWSANPPSAPEPKPTPVPSAPPAPVTSAQVLAAKI